MPFPIPESDEDRDAFIARCMNSEALKREFPDDEQRRSLCHLQFDEQSAQRRDRNETSSTITSEVIALFSDDVIKFNGQEFVPDDTKGYFTFNISTAFPQGATYYGTALHSAVIDRSYRTLVDQPLNYEHQVRHYFKKPGKETNVEDRFLGSIRAVDFARQPAGGWKLSLNSAPCITGVSSYWKNATGMNKILGDHQTGRHKYSVSMEVEYRPMESGFAVAHKGKPTFDSTPSDFAEAGFDYVPYADAPEELRATFSEERNRIIGRYKNRDTFLLMGGLDKNVHYAGVGLVKYGAERTAEITRMAASGGPILADVFSGLPSLLEEAFRKCSKTY